jgi:hypothetical protein
MAKIHLWDKPLIDILAAAVHTYIKARIYKRRNITYMRIYIKVITAALAAVGAAVGVAVAVAVVVGGWRWLRSSSEAVVFLDTAITRSAGQ